MNFTPEAENTCNICGGHFGIDLSVFGVGTNVEAEVVFPTIRECVTKVQYIDELDM